MKKFIFCLLLMPVLLKAQVVIESPELPIDTLNHKISYTEVVHADSLSKEQIFSCAKEWFTREFEYAQAIVSYEDYSTGRIIARGTKFGMYHKGLAALAFTLSFTINITVKDGKYKYEITDFVLLNGLDKDMLPDMFAADVFVNDPAYKNSKGVYTGSNKDKMAFLDGNAKMILQRLKYIISLKKFSHKINGDF